MGKEKVGLGIVTFNRPEYLKQCLEAASKNNYGGADCVEVYDDGSEEVHEIHNIADWYNVNFTPGLKNKGVAHAKNKLLKFLIEEGCTHIFLMEDDQLIQDRGICKYYIDYARMVGIKHMNFALHGPMNISKQSSHNGVCVYPDCVGAFSYYHKDVIEQVGYMDENFKNVWEHVEHTYRIAKAGMTTPFWYFADHPYSDKLIKEIPGSIDKSSIRPKSDWQDNINKGRDYFIKKHGCWLPPRPTWQL